MAEISQRLTEEEKPQGELKKCPTCGERGKIKA
jgi:hypothetical protein